ncbi:MAG: hypothetical protein U1F77_13325 [Kiritimatiellia bacterium]
MKKILISIALVLLMVLAWPLLAFSAWNVYDWMKFKRHYGDYMSWKRNGGPFQAAYLEPLNLDRHRDGMVSDLSGEEILKKFPFLTEGGTFLAPNSYKAQYLRHARTDAPGLKVLWFRPEDGWDWCIEIQDGKATVNVIKG